MIIDFKTENFEEEIKTGKVLVDFYAVWCGPCKMMHPVIEEIAKENPNLKIIKVDVDQHEELAQRYGIMSIPTLLFLKDGEVVEKRIGFTPKEILAEWISKES